MSRPYNPAPTTNRFHVPRTLAADFTKFLDGDIPNTVMNFEILKNWYDKFEEDYEPTYIRGELYPDSTKSRYENTDNNMNIRCDVNSGIRKGDIVIDENGYIYTLDWEVALQSNNAPSRALRCNMYLTVKRYVEEVVDDEGYLVTEEGWVNLFENMPANAYRYDGRPEYSAVSGTPGIAPNALTLMTFQYNELTKDVRIDDRFVWGNDEYLIVDIDWVGVGLDNAGTIKIQAKKVPGGMQ